MTYLTTESKGVPIAEDHRFLHWQPSRRDVMDWSDWFKRRGVEHVVADSAIGWTIYKHMWDEARGGFCCGAAA